MCILGENLNRVSDKVWAQGVGNESNAGALLWPIILKVLLCISTVARGAQEACNDVHQTNLFRTSTNSRPERNG